MKARVILGDAQARTHRGGVVLHECERIRIAQVADISQRVESVDTSVEVLVGRVAEQVDSPQARQRAGECQRIIGGIAVGNALSHYTRHTDVEASTTIVELASRR